MKNDEIKEKVKEYIQGVVYVDKDKINNESLIFKEGYFDSMGFITLITFLEENFVIKIGDKDLIEENFESINAIANFITSKN